MTDRGIQLETPRPYFLTPFTPNAAFYVRYHLDLIPNAVDLSTWAAQPGGQRRATAPAQLRRAGEELQGRIRRGRRTPPLADGEGRELVQSFCGICHSTTYITMQPPLPGATWERLVNKMIGTFGAPIAEPSAQAILAYLKSHYTPETRKE